MVEHKNGLTGIRRARLGDALLVNVQTLVDPLWKDQERIATHFETVDLIVFDAQDRLRRLECLRVVTVLTPPEMRPVVIRPDEYLLGTARRVRIDSLANPPICAVGIWIVPVGDVPQVRNERNALRLEELVGGQHLVTGSWRRIDVRVGHEPRREKRFVLDFFRPRKSDLPQDTKDYNGNETHSVHFSSVQIHRTISAWFAP